MRILVFSTLFPNAIQPHHGIFVENRLRKLLSSNEVEAKVVSPVPWFPLKHSVFGDYADYAKVPYKEFRYGIDILHPRYLVIPKIGMVTTPLFLAISALPHINSIIKQGFDFDIIDAHYYYPDGVAAVLLSQWFDKPVTITARGTDLNLIPKYYLPRRMIKYAARKACASITVCAALKNELEKLGVNEVDITVLRNGVDLELFKPCDDREGIRQKLDIHGRTLISVGHLIERKGHHLIIEALTKLPDMKLLIAGDGPEENRLHGLVQKFNLTDRVRFLGTLDPYQLCEYYSAADLLVLASSREGWANVLLESMASGTPVVATKVWGTPEVVAAPEVGILVNERDVHSITGGIRKLFLNYPSREMTRKYAENFSWDDTIHGQLKIFNDIIEKNK